MILRSKVRVSPDKLQELYKEILEQSKTGIIILPDYIEVIELDKDLTVSDLYNDALTNIGGYSNENPD